MPQTEEKSPEEKTYLRVDSTDLVRDPDRYATARTKAYFDFIDDIVWQEEPDEPDDPAHFEPDEHPTYKLYDREDPPEGTLSLYAIDSENELNNLIPEEAQVGGDPYHEAIHVKGELIEARQEEWGLDGETHTLLEIEEASLTPFE